MLNVQQHIEAPRFYCIWIGEQQQYCVLCLCIPTTCRLAQANEHWLIRLLQVPSWRRCCDYLSFLSLGHDAKWIANRDVLRTYMMEQMLRRNAEDGWEFYDTLAEACAQQTNRDHGNEVPSEGVSYNTILTKSSPELSHGGLILRTLS